MMKKFTLLKSAVLTSAALLSFSPVVNAGEQPNAADLVGNVYGGIHALHMRNDDDRLINANPNSSLDHGSGMGVELGYRWTESTEVRLSYSDINLVPETWGFNAPNGNSTALDILYFPTRKNFYVLGGLDSLDLEDRRTSLDVGAGYRHYLSERAALYLEGKGHYQFSDHYEDWSSKIGFVYFFGEGGKSSQTVMAPQSSDVDNDGVLDNADQCPNTPKADTVDEKGCSVFKDANTSPMAQTVVADIDQDGILDSADQCPNTPKENKVDANGCTIFEENEVSIKLLINFDNNQSVVKAENFDEISKAANFLKKYSHTSLTIEGHSSSQGSAAYNKNLSQKRADAIVKVLVDEFDIDASRLTAKGYGEERLIDTANTSTAHKINRRVEAVVSATEKAAVKR